MKEQVKVSVTTVYGSRHFVLTKRKQRILGFSVAGLLFVFITAFFALNYLMDALALGKEREQALQTQSLSLSEELKMLAMLKESLEDDLDERAQHLNEVSKRLGDLEDVLGLDDEKPQELDSRFDLATLTGAVKMSLLQELPNGQPVKKARRSSFYGPRVHPVTKKKTMHRGIDFAVNIGTPIYAPADGVVETLRNSREGSGNFLRLQHNFGFSSSYSHLQSFKVKTGEFVKKGQLIALSGNTGLSSGPHLHYEVRFVGRALNPLYFVDWDLNNFDKIFEQEKTIPWDYLINSIQQRVSLQQPPSLPPVAKLMVNSN